MYLSHLECFQRLIGLVGLPLEVSAIAVGPECGDEVAIFLLDVWREILAILGVQVHAGIRASCERDLHSGREWYFADALEILDGFTDERQQLDGRGSAYTAHEHVNFFPPWGANKNKNKKLKIKNGKLRTFPPHPTCLCDILSDSL